jgi:hypothetical protein
MNEKEVSVIKPTSTFSVVFTTARPDTVIRLRIITDRDVNPPTLAYAGHAMTRLERAHCTTCTCHARPGKVHYYEVVNPGTGTALVTGQFDTDTMVEVRIKEMTE